jgi:selenocysteine lyase/cysteine desulfurase
MESKKALFQLPEDIHYINCSYMSPLMKSVEDKGIEGIRLKRNPADISPLDFFTGTVPLRDKFSKLVNCQATQVAIMPSVSYGIMSAVKNVPFKANQHALVVSDEFPSGYFAAKSWCERYNAELKVIHPPTHILPKAEKWNAEILASITEYTALIVISSVHWMDGTKFDLKAIGEKCQLTGTKFLVDGTQSVGAYSIDVEAYHIDALICAGYKWLLGPYSIAIGYFGEVFNLSEPLEESWMNRSESEDFSKLSNYSETYTPDAGRFNMGQTSNFIAVPMLDEALRNILDWGTDAIQAYCRQLTSPLLNMLTDWGIKLENESGRCQHLVSIQLPESNKSTDLLQEFKNNKVFLSVRGSSLRISPNVYNTEEDIQKVMQVLEKNLN